MTSYNFIPVGAVIYGKQNNFLTVLENRGETLLIQHGDKTGVIDISKVSRWSYGGFSIGDRVTLADKYQLRAADVGTVENITAQGIQVFWDNNSSGWPGLKQPPTLHRTYQPTELEGANNDERN